MQLGNKEGPLCIMVLASVNQLPHESKHMESSEFGEWESLKTTEDNSEVRQGESEEGRDHKLGLVFI